jgi:undecaprenyldiphospho-muramoylpentapeptide beta-N-acetylglucosaminyltransferase
VYPALAVLQKLISSGKCMSQDTNHPSNHLDISEVLWVGGEGGMEIELLKRENVPLKTIPAAGIHGVSARALPGNIWRILRGLVAARQVLKKYCPDVILFTGGFIGVPVVLATKFKIVDRKRSAVLAYVPDIEPGLALKIISRLADHIAVTTDDSCDFFPSKKNITVTGYPIRENLLGWGREDAYKALKLTTGFPTLLILGGSQGARSINSAVMDILPELLSEMQVIHITGTLDWSEVNRYKTERLNKDQADHFHAYPYLHEEMGAALSAADLVVTRAGASTLGELPLFGLPAILIPYPYAWRYQITNAKYLANRGAALVLADGGLKEKLLPLVQDLIGDKGSLNAMGKAMKSLARPTAADAIGDLILNLGSTKSQKKD